MSVYGLLACCKRAEVSVELRKPSVFREREREMFYLTTHSTHFIYGYMASDIWLRTILIVREVREREIFYLTTHSTHFIYGYMASDIWLRTILIVREVTRCRHIGYSFRLPARVLLYAPSHRQDNTAFVKPVVEHWLEREIAQWVQCFEVNHWNT